MLVISAGKLLPNAMKDPEGRRVRSFEKCNELGITVLTRTSLAGRYEFMTLLDVPSLGAAVEFALFFRSEGYGDAEIIPVIDHTVDGPLPTS